MNSGELPPSSVTLLLGDRCGTSKNRQARVFLNSLTGSFYFLEHPSVGFSPTGFDSLQSMLLFKYLKNKSLSIRYLGFRTMYAFVFTVFSLEHFG